MTYYIDFDHTLYNTPALTKRMLDFIAKSATLENNELNITDVLNYCKSKFGRRADQTYDVYKLINWVVDVFNLENREAIKTGLNELLSNTQDLIFKDVPDFFQKLTKVNEKSGNDNAITLVLFSSQPFGDEFPYRKIAGSGILKYFYDPNTRENNMPYHSCNDDLLKTALKDSTVPCYSDYSIENYNIIASDGNKYDYELPYSDPDVYFVDDKPEDIENFIKNGAKNIIRIRRPGDTYSNIDIKPSIKEEHQIYIPEYTTLNKVPIPFIPQKDGAR